MRIATTIVLVCASGGLAAADNKVEVLDRGTAVEIIAHDVKAASTAIAPVRSRLEVPLVGMPVLSTTSSDKTVKVIETTGRTGAKSLSIKLGLERPEVAGLAKYAQAIQVGNDLHVLIPRALPAAGLAFELPEPTLPPAMAAKAAAIAPVPTLSTELTHPEAGKPIDMPKPEAAKADASMAHAKPVAPDPKPDAKVDAKVDAKIANAPEPKESRNFPILIALCLAAVGCFAWLKRKNGTPAVREASQIEVIAQRSLGGKAKVVWLRAGGRDIIVSVTPGAVHSLGQWKKTGDSAGPAANLTMRASGRIQLPEATANEKPSSPAVAGILKLRARTNVPFVNEDVATDDVDADAVWAKEILAATTGARR